MNLLNTTPLEKLNQVSPYAISTICITVILGYFVEYYLLSTWIYQTIYSGMANLLVSELYLHSMHPNGLIYIYTNTFME